MKIRIDKRYFKGDPGLWLKRAGYALIVDHRRGKESYVRRLGRGFYPRLHLYFTIESDDVVFDLHLDQKQASYPGAHMHNAEYDGPVLEQEVERLKNILVNNK